MLKIDYKVTDKKSLPPVIETERLILRRVTRADEADIFAYASDPEATRFMLWETHKTREDTRAFIEYTLKEYETGRHWDYAFELKSEQRLIGTGGVFNKVDVHCTEIGYIISREYWGRGLVPEAMGALTDYLFTRANVHRIEAKHFLENEKSGRVMQKLGMSYEGTLKDKLFARNAYQTVKLYAMINPAHK